MSTYSYTNKSVYEAIKPHYSKFDAYINLTMYPRGEQNPQRVYSGHISELPVPMLFDLDLDNYRNVTIVMDAPGIINVIVSHYNNGDDFEIVHEGD